MHLLSAIVIYFTVLIKVAEGAGLPVTGDVNYKYGILLNMSRTIQTGS